MAERSKEALSQGEFIALMAMLAATVAFSIDAMLPALPEIGADFSPEAPNRAQLILTSFVFGMGIGTFITGPLSDTYGRKPVMVAGAFLYVISAAAAYFASSLEIMLVARVLQGLGAAGPRVVALAMIRDLYGGRDMARIISFVMLVFTLVPALAPTLGYYIILGFGWRAIFIAFVVFMLLISTWLVVRQPETLTLDARRSLKIKELYDSSKEVLSNQTTQLSIIAQTLAFAILFANLSTVQPIFDDTFGQGDVFHLWFGGIAVLSASASLLNARLVGRIGMRAIVRRMFQVLVLSATVVLLTYAATSDQTIRFVVFLVFVLSGFFGAGLTIGNLNALGMEPMGHIAGLAASIIAALSTVAAVVIAVPVGLAYDGTPVPVAIAVAICGALGFFVTTRIKRPGEV